MWSPVWWLEKIKWLSLAFPWYCHYLWINKLIRIWYQVNVQARVAPIIEPNISATTKASSYRLMRPAVCLTDSSRYWTNVRKKNNLLIIMLHRQCGGFPLGNANPQRWTSETLRWETRSFFFVYGRVRNAGDVVSGGGRDCWISLKSKATRHPAAVSRISVKLFLLFLCGLRK